MKNKTSREEIMFVAFKLFLEHGYSKVSIKNICDEIGITRPTFYKYADNKEELIVDIYNLILKSIIRDAIRQEELSSPYTEFVRVHAEFMNTLRSYGADLFSALIMTNLVKDEGSFNLNPEMVEITRRLIQNAMDKGEISNRLDADKVTSIVGSMFDGLVFNWCLTKRNNYFSYQFFESLNSLLDVKEDLRDIYKTYLEEESQYRTVDPTVLLANLYTLNHNSEC